MKQQLFLKNPESDPRIRVAANNLDVSTIDLVTERFRLWDAEDAPLEEQNDLLLEILETSPQKSKQKSKDRKRSKSDKSQQQQQATSPPTSQLRVSEWANLGLLGRMMGIATAEGAEPHQPQQQQQQQQQPTQVCGSFSSLFFLMLLLFSDSLSFLQSKARTFFAAAMKKSAGFS